MRPRTVEHHESYIRQKLYIHYIYIIHYTNIPLPKFQNLIFSVPRLEGIFKEVMQFTGKHCFNTNKCSFTSFVH